MEALGESAQLVVGLVEIFSSDFDFTADTKVGDRFRLLTEKRYAGDKFVDYGQLLVAQYVSDGRVLTGLLLREEGEVLVLADAQGQEVRVPKETVEDRMVAQLSLMPPNLGEQIPEPEFYDLLRFLLDQREMPASP